MMTNEEDVMLPQVYPPVFDEELLPADPMNRIVPNLWVGGGDVEPADAFADGFEVMVTLVGYGRDDVRPPLGATYLHWSIADSIEELPDDRMLGLVADVVAHAVGNGRPTLVACSAGLNRSGMVAALALQRLGHAPEATVELLRAARGPYALCNGLFERRVLAGN